MANAIIKRKAYEVEISLIKQEIHILAANQDAAVGKIIKFDLTRILRGKNLEANLIIRKENDKLIADFVSLNLVQSYIRRMMRRGINYIEDSSVYPTKEGKFIIKPFLLTRRKVHRSIRKEIRNKTKESIAEFVKEKSNKEIFFSIIYGGMQKEISSKIKKICPIALVEIRVAKIK